MWTDVASGARTDRPQLVLEALQPETHTGDLDRGPFTLHQIRHSKLTHAAEGGASTPMLMKLSGHTSVRSLAKYARVSAEALATWQAAHDPAARRSGRR